MEWMDFESWDSEVFLPPFALRGWKRPEPTKTAPKRVEVDARVRDFVNDCPKAHLDRCAPTQLR